MEGMLGEVAERKLYDAAAKGDLIAFQELLQQDPLLLNRVSYTSSNKTPLHIATLHGNASIVEEILNRSPQLAEELDSQQRSALHVASAKGQVEIASKLLSADPEMCLSRDCQGRNPLHLAAIKGHVRAVELLLRRAPVAATERLDRGQTVLHLCVKCNQLEALKVLVPYLSELVSAKDDDGETPLHLAARYKQVEIIQYLVGNTNTDKNSKNSRGHTPPQILEQTPSSFSDTTTSEILNIHQPRIPTSSTTTTTQAQPLEWLTKKRDSIMVVAILIATMAFQAAVSPAGGVWQDDSSPQDSQGIPHKAGEAVMAYNHPSAYKSFMRSNTVAFVSSLSTILQLISGLPFRHRLFMWILMVVMWLAVTSIAVTYAASIMVVTPRKDKQSLSHVIETGITVWCCVMAILLVGNTLRLLDRWLRSRGVTVWRPKRLRRILQVKHHHENGNNEGV